MMKSTRIISIAVFFASFTAGTSQAQNLRDHTAPAEFPPETYQGTQYVDSKGCVYIRAGIDGTVTWVPRVNRQRKLICGQTPTLGKAQPVAVVQAPSQRATGAPEEITIATPAAAVPTTTTSTAVATKPKSARPVAATAPSTSTKPPNRTTRATVSGQPGPLTRVIPSHVYEARSVSEGYVIPKGYERVWDDDRLNPRRAEQNLNGIASMRLIWTRTVPRRLIEQKSGRDLTATVPLVYPYTDVNTQEENLGKVTIVRVDGKIKKRVVRNRTKTRSAAPRKVKSRRRYVQIGTYGNASNAKTAAQLVANSGLPAGIGNVRRRGKTYQVVVAGPFTSSTELSKGLERARAIGFGDAFVRK